MSPIRFALLVLAASLVSGCASNHQAATQPMLKAGASRFVVYRESGKTAAFVGPTIYVNGRELGKLLPKTCVEVSLEPGDYELKSDGNFFTWPGPQRLMRVSLQPNTARFVELVIIDDRATIVNHTYANRTEVEALKALAEIGACAKKSP